MLDTMTVDEVQREIDSFLKHIAGFCDVHPQAASFVGQAENRGVMTAFAVASGRAADMEMALATLLADKLDGHSSRLVMNWIERNKDKLTVPFDFYLEKLREISDADKGTTCQIP